MLLYTGLQKDGLDDCQHMTGRGLSFCLPKKFIVGVFILTY